MNEPTRLSREATQEQTRLRLIEAAWQHIAERGFAATTVRDIARAAGYTQGAFYSNFSSKEGLLLDLLREHKRAVTHNMQRLFEQANDDFDAMLAALRTWSRELSQDTRPALLAAELQLMAARQPEFGAAYAELMNEQRDAYAQLIASQFERQGKRPPAPVSELAAALMAMVMGQMIGHAQHGTTESGDALVAIVRGLLLAP